MFRHYLFLCFLVCGAHVTYSADIAIVSGGAETALQNVLQGAGHNVIAVDSFTTALPDTSAVDLVIVSRNGNSGNYDDSAAEITSWQTLDAPLLLFHAFVQRANRWGYYQTSALSRNVSASTWTINNAGSDLLPPGVNTDYLMAGETVDVNNSLAVPSGAEVVLEATNGTATWAALVDFPVGTTLSSAEHGGVTNQTVSRHVSFIPSDASGEISLGNQNVQDVLLHIVAVLTSEVQDDLDNDGVLNADEDFSLGVFQGAGVLPAWSDPSNDDTDGDLVVDGVEILSGTDPNDASSVPVASGFHAIEDFEDVNFVVGSTFDGINGWVTEEPALALIGNDPVGSGRGKVARLGQGVFYDSYKSLEEFRILDGATGTFFFELYVESLSLIHI